MVGARPFRRGPDPALRHLFQIPRHSQTTGSSPYRLPGASPSRIGVGPSGSASAVTPGASFCSCPTAAAGSAVRRPLGATVSLVKVPETMFVRSGQSYVGYQVLGDGPVDLVYAGTAFTNVDAQWGLPTLAEFLERLSSFSRLILFDKRGVGVSDPVFHASMPTIEDWGDDLNAVLDAVGSERAVLFGRPGRRPRLPSLCCDPPGARRRAHPSRLLRVRRRAAFRTDRRGGLRNLDLLRRRSLAEGGRHLDARGPRPAKRLRPVPPSLCEPGRPGHPSARRRGRWICGRSWGRSVARTLVLDTNGHLLEGEGEYLSEHIVGASRIALASGSPIDSPEIVDAVGEFVTGARLPVEADSILATILFTDIVNSTGTAATLGDRTVGGTCSSATGRPCAPSYVDFGVGRSTPAATTFSRPSTAQRERFVAPRRSRGGLSVWACK